MSSGSDFRFCSKCSKVKMEPLLKKASNTKHCSKCSKCSNYLYKG
nr:MAG TPA: palmitoyltransferase [Bacteriophage sp.]